MNGCVNHNRLCSRFHHQLVNRLYHVDLANGLPINTVVKQIGFVYMTQQDFKVFGKVRGCGCGRRLNAMDKCRAE